MTDAIVPLPDPNPVRAIDMFCGIGGNSLGAQQAGVEIVAGFDMWQLAGDVYHDNFPNARFYPSRLQDINLRRIRRELGQIDLILASPECTSHSVARGNRVRSIESLNLAYQVLRFARTLNPRWIVIENVAGMKSWSGYTRFLDEMKILYHVYPQHLVASDFGVPQSRRRLFILCDRDAIPPVVQVHPGGLTPPAAQVINMNGTYPYSPLVTEKRAIPTLERARRAMDVLGDDSSFLLVYYGSDKAGGWQRLTDPLRTITTVDRFALVRPGEDGNGHVMRMLQPEELKPAMGFPADFILNHGTRRDKIHLLGNAVCPPVQKSIIETLIGRDRLAIPTQLAFEQITGDG
jgi:DNA (cytosine-5)-methyltransferase 1